MTIYHKLEKVTFADLTDVTLANEDTNSKPTDNANKTIKGMWHHLVAKYATYTSGATWSLYLVQVTKSISGSVVPLPMFVKKTVAVEIAYFSNQVRTSKS